MFSSHPGQANKLLQITILHGRSIGPASALTANLTAVQWQLSNDAKYGAWRFCY